MEQTPSQGPCAPCRASRVKCDRERFAGCLRCRGRPQRTRLGGHSSANLERTIQPSQTKPPCARARRPCFRCRRLGRIANCLGDVAATESRRRRGAPPRRTQRTLVRGRASQPVATGPNGDHHDYDVNRHDRDLQRRLAADVVHGASNGKPHRAAILQPVALLAPVLIDPMVRTERS